MTTIPPSADDWRAELRRGWQDEISNMEADEKDWFVEVGQQQWLSNLRQAWATDIDSVVHMNEQQEELILKQQQLLSSASAASTPPPPSELVDSGSDQDMMMMAMLCTPTKRKDDNSPVTLTETELHTLKTFVEEKCRNWSPVVGRPVKVHKKGFSTELWNWLTNQKKASTNDDAPDYSKQGVEAYTETLKKALDKHEERIMFLQSERRKVREKMRSELSLWQKYAVESLIETGKTLFSNQLVQLSTMLDVEWYYCDVLTRTINTIQMVADQGEGISDAFKTTWTDDGYVSPEMLEGGLAGGEVTKKVQHCKDLSVEISKLKLTYEEMKRKGLKVDSKAERTRKLKKLLRNGVKSHRSMDKPIDLYFHFHNKRDQQLFRCMMLDQRHHEGALIQRWKVLISKSKAIDLSSKAIQTFIECFTADTMKKYDIVSAYKQQEELDLAVECFQLYMQRLLFVQIRGTLFQLGTKNEKEADIVLSQKRKLLQPLTQGQIGIEEHLRCPPEQMHDHPAYNHAIYKLQRLREEDVPVDMVYCILECIRHINRQARLYHHHYMEKKCNGILGGILSLDLQDDDGDGNDVGVHSNKGTFVYDPSKPKGQQQKQLLLHLKDNKKNKKQQEEKQAQRKQTLTDQPPPPSSVSAEQHKRLHKVELNADLLFPIVVWCVIHADVPDMNYKLATIVRFCKNVTHFGEIGMSLSLVEAAIMHVLRFTQESIHHQKEQEEELVQPSDTHENVEEKKEENNNNNNDKIKKNNNNNKKYQSSNAGVYNFASKPDKPKSNSKGKRRSSSQGSDAIDNIMNLFKT